VATEAECDTRLARQVQTHATGLQACLTRALPVKTEAAFVSWTYNVGVGAACKSTLVRKVNAGDLRGACNELLKWNKAGGRVVRGLTNRRNAERALCLEGLK
jgi:GH24 family phage-related lysozyme (muramidase)